MRYGVWCAVWGGVTGHRESWLKERDRIREFSTLTEAACCAADLNQRTNGNPYRKANFSYTVRSLPEDIM